MIRNIFKNINTNNNVQVCVGKSNIQYSASEIEDKTIDIESSASIKCYNGKLLVDGKEVDSVKDYKVCNLIIQGDVVNINCDCSVEVKGSVGGDIDCNGSVKVGGDMHGDIDCNGGVTIKGNHTGDIDAMGSVNIK